MAIRVPEDAVREIIVQSSIPRCVPPHFLVNTPAMKSPVRRQVDWGPRTSDTVMEENKTQHQEDFLSALAVLKRELMDSFERKLQTLQAQIQQVGTADAIQFYPQTYRYPQRAIPHHITQMPTY